MPRVIATASAPWGRASASRAATVAPYPAAEAQRVGVVAPWSAGRAEHPSQRLVWGVMLPTDRAAALPWAAARPRLLQMHRLPWGTVTARDTLAALPWGLYLGHPAARGALDWPGSAPRDRSAVLPWGMYVPRNGLWVLTFPGNQAYNPRWVLPWTRYSRPLPVGWGIPSPPGEGPGTPGFGIVPVQRSYIVINDVSLVRVSDSTAIPALGLQIDFDVDTGLIGWSATVQGSALGLVEPPGAAEPVEVQAAINGDTFRLLVEQIQRDRAFPTSRLQITGRGIAARLAAPYAAEVSRDNTAGALTAAQLAVDALTINATPIGWDIDMGLTDWLVPAGAWAHTGTHFAAVQAIAAAAGGYVRADRVAQTLYLRPRWPVLPWELASATPDIVLPDAAVARESLRWVERPEYDGVYVSGESQGVLALCRRTGFAGDLLAPMAVDPLITHDDAARQRALAEIGIPGRSALLRLDLQVLPATGVIEIGTILQFTDGATPRIGIVRSVSVRYQHPTLRQSVELECHA